jgi:non-specific serine/threonine protein kinase/serine/threonine-protein kinase
MTPERWQKISEIYYSALEQPSGQRAVFLAEVCAGDEALRQEVESLLDAEPQVTGFLDSSAFDAVFQTLAPDDLSSPEQRIGPYKLIREIGRGGMGAVFLAVRDDDEYKKEVAIKLIKRGMDSDFILARFLSERQILASFHHPNIARLLDGGTTEEGLPYFVMEYIEGLAIDAYCDEYKLSIIERLKLFREVCSAVHYAHQRLVIHRDIKPSNILVTAEGVPHLLDFGIAKLLAPDSRDYVTETATMMRLMTPEYASPEQARGEHITTASDIYSLGVVLYELLTGHPPYRFSNRSPLAIAQVISETDPEKPSTVIDRVQETSAGADAKTEFITPHSISATREGSLEKLRRRLRGDLDNIVLMAMRKDKKERYLSAEQFSEDLRRYLEGHPVLARQPTFAYRASKFIRRNKVAVLAALLLLLSLVGGILATSWQARAAKRHEEVAVRERGKAERRFNEVRELANKVLFEYHEAIRNLPGSTPVREKLLADARQYLDNLAAEAAGDATLQSELATAYEQLASLQGGLADPNLGRTEVAIEIWQKARQMREALLAADASNLDNRSRLATCYGALGALFAEQGDSEATLDNYRKGLETLEALVAEAPESKLYLYQLATGYSNFGAILTEFGDSKGAGENVDKAVNMFETLLQTSPGHKNVRRSLSACYWGIGNALMETGDLVGALENNRKAIVLIEELAKEEPTNMDYRRLVSVYYSGKSAVLAAGDKIAEALESSMKAKAISEALLAADPQNAEFRVDVSGCHLAIGDLLTKANKNVEASASFRKAFAFREEVAQTDPTNLWKRWLMIEAGGKTAKSLARSGRLREASGLYQKILSLLEATNDQDESAEVGNARAHAYKDIAEACTLAAVKKPVLAERNADWQKARNLYQKARDIWLHLQQQGTLSTLEKETLDQTTREISRCEAALAR